MTAYTKRVRDGTGAVTTLNLADADAADRRLDVPAAFNSKGGKRLLGFTWKKSAAEATDVHIYRVDAANSDKLYLLEKRLADTSTDGVWRPDEEEIVAGDPDAPGADGIGFRIQFSQAGAACTADVTADFKDV